MKRMYMFTDKEIKKVCDCNTRLISATSLAMENLKKEEYDKVKDALQHILKLCYEQEDELLMQE